MGIDCIDICGNFVIEGLFVNIYNIYVSIDGYFLKMK